MEDNTPPPLTLVHSADRRSDTIRVAIAVSQPLLRAGCRAILERDDRIALIGEANSADQAVELARGMDPVVVLIDVGLLGSECVQATRRLLDEPGVAVVLLSGPKSDSRCVWALRAGASRVLPRDAEADDLLGTVEAVAGGQTLPPRASRRARVQRARRRGSERRRANPRSAKERQSWNSDT
jgi:DNA-binding NarL/FixJ family response regulator